MLRDSVDNARAPTSQHLNSMDHHTGADTQDYTLMADPHTRYTHTFNGPLSGTTRVSRYQKGKTNLDFTEARDSEWQWHQLGRVQVCTSPQADNHASTPPLSFLQAGCPSCRPTNSVKALMADPCTKFEVSTVSRCRDFTPGVKF